MSVDVYNETVSNQGLSPDEMRAVCAELKGEAGELDDLKFDVVAVSTNLNVFRVVANRFCIVCLVVPPLRLHRRHDSHVDLLSETGRSVAGDRFYSN